MEILQSLNIDVRLIVVNMIGFLILVFAAKKLIFTPIGTVLEERATEINTGYDRLDASQREMETLKADYEARLNAVEAEARDKIQTAIKEAQASRDQILADANAKSREIITRAEAEANREKEQAMITLRQQIVDIAMRTTTHVVGESLDSARHQKLVDEFIARDAAEA
ncbi:MAG: F0F1 ATP synthase subunit B [Armatimonadota bacterium]